MVGSEVYSSEVKKTEVLMEHFRRAIGRYCHASLLFHGLLLQQRNHLQLSRLHTGAVPITLWMPGHTFHGNHV